MIDIIIFSTLIWISCNDLNRLNIGKMGRFQFKVLCYSAKTFSSFISPILKIPWCTIIKYNFQCSIPTDKSISNYRYFTYNESQEFETKDMCTDLFFRLFCLLAIQSFVSFVYLISVKQFKKSFIESLFVAKIHSRYGTLL